LMVSPRLRAEWANGADFYEQETVGEPIGMPTRKADRPNREFLNWHADTVFQAS